MNFIIRSAVYLLIFKIILTSFVFAQINERYILNSLFQIAAEIKNEYYLDVDDSVLFSGAVLEMNRLKNIKSGEKSIYSKQQFSSYFYLLCKQYPNDKALIGEYAVRGMIKSLNDPYALFFDSTQWDYYKKVSSGAEFAGIGVELAVKDRCFVVIASIDGSPAEKSGILPGDIIVAIDSKNISQMDTTDALNLFDGQENSKIKLTVKRNGTFLNFDITRKFISLPAPKASLLKLRNQNTGYIKIYYFGDKTDSQVKEFLDTFKTKGIKNVIIDLRDNPGGDFKASLRLSSFFTGENALVKIQKKGRPLETVYGTENADYDFNLAILINKGSASASEVFASALHDNKKCVLVGTGSFGKALIQSVYSLPGNAGCKITTAKYYTTSGKDILNKGLSPDITVNTVYPLLPPASDPVVLRVIREFTNYRI